MFTSLLLQTLDRAGDPLLVAFWQAPMEGSAGREG